ncbi:MAG: hypothetical protein K2Q09_00565 [Phycisphaerales bacterium]|nr:hypothetical protein [Phycisphaerales bacterium]
MKDKLRKSLSLPGLLETLSSSFDKVKEPSSKAKISIKDCLLSGYAVFSMKYASLLQFDTDSHEDDGVKHNLHSLYGIETIPCDTYMRERLDEVSPAQLRPAYKALFSLVQHHKMLEGFEFMEGYYLLLLDGTGEFSSHTVHCENCCMKRHKNGTVTYYHQVLSAVIAHPDSKIVLPLCPEPILKQDGRTKNDCERNAAKRLIQDFRREHPHLKAIVIEDGLASNAPHIKDLKASKLRFILGAKPDDHKWLFDWVNAGRAKEHVLTKAKLRHRFRYMNDVPLNDSNSDCRVNFLEYWEEDASTGKVQQHFSWVTDFHLTEGNVYQLMRGGRARWKIENETFNTLKNQGYHFEHNFGHGYKNLNTVLGHLMMLAFLIDQIQQLCCPLFQAALKRLKTKLRLWETWRRHCVDYLFTTWNEFLRALAYGIKKSRPIIDTG